MCGVRGTKEGKERGVRLRYITVQQASGKLRISPTVGCVERLLLLAVATRPQARIGHCASQLRLPNCSLRLLLDVTRVHIRASAPVAASSQSQSSSQTTARKGYDRSSLAFVISLISFLRARRLHPQHFLADPSVSDPPSLVRLGRAFPIVTR